MAKLRVLGENPPPPRGNGENQLRELRDYLTRLKDELEFLMTHLGEDNFAESLATWVTDTGKSIDDINTALAGKQDTLTFDDTPTSGSENPVKSGGVYTALAGKEDADRFIVVDTDNFTLANLTWSSQSSGAVYAIEIPITGHTGYHPVAATLSRFVSWVPAANLKPYIAASNNKVYLLSEVNSTTLGSSAKAGLRIVFEKDVSP